MHKNIGSEREGSGSLMIVDPVPVLDWPSSRFLLLKT